jgi:hypothetical protein
MSEYRRENLRKYLHFIGVAVLLAGLGGAAAIYLSSGDYSKSAQIYEDGYPVAPEDTKQYLRDMELYGGTANVLADELRNWFVGLWHGESLAVIVASITILTSAGIFYLSYHLPER